MAFHAAINIQNLTAIFLHFITVINTYYYESESGKKGKIKKDFSVSIKEMSAHTEETKEDETSQWWIIMAVIAGALCLSAGYGIFRVIKKKEWRKA